MAILNAGDVGAHEAGALLDVPLGELFLLTQSAQAVADNHIADYSRWMRMAQAAPRFRDGRPPLILAFAF